MTIRIKLVNQSNVFGALASGLCLAHCIAFPILISLNASHITIPYLENSPWWHSLDVFFLLISLLAIITSANRTTNKYIPYALWINWVVLAFILFNEKFHLIAIPEEAIYIPSLALIALHIYNRKYCNCKDETCCAEELK